MDRYEVFQNVNEEWLIQDKKKGKTVSWSGVFPLSFKSEKEALDFIQEQVKQYGYV